MSNHSCSSVFTRTDHLSLFWTTAAVPCSQWPVTCPYFEPQLQYCVHKGRSLVPVLNHSCSTVFTMAGHLSLFWTTAAVLCSQWPVTCPCLKPQLQYCVHKGRSLVPILNHSCSTVFTRVGHLSLFWTSAAILCSQGSATCPYSEPH
jgi:putative hemolysin